MSKIRVLGGLGLAVLALGACEPMQPTGSPVTMTPGSREEMARQAQIQSMQGDAGRASQNPIATGAAQGGGFSQGVARAPGTGGQGSAAAGAPVAVSPGVGGIQRAPGVGAPSTR